MTWIALGTIAHSLMVNAIVLKAYIHFALIYTTEYIFPVLPIKYLINKYGDPTMSFKLATGTKPSVSHLRVLFFPCVLRKAIAHFGTKALNMRHQAQKVFRGIFFGITKHKKWYLVYVPSTRKIIYSYDLFSDESFSSTLAYMSQLYSEVMDVRPDVSYIPCAKSSKEKLAM